MAPLTLLFGMPRSGTTWLGKIFDSHENTLYRHEPDDRGVLNFLPMFTTSDDDQEARAKVQAFVAALWSRQEAKVVGSLPIFPKRYMPPLTHALRQIAVPASKVAPKWIGMIPRAGFYERLSASAVQMVWKSVESLGRLGTIARINAHSRGVLILRHPCGYVASTLKGEGTGRFEGNCAAAQDLPIFQMMLATSVGRLQGLDLRDVSSMSEAERLALRWAIYSEHALCECDAIDRVQVVRYEDVCFDTHVTIERLFAHCGLRLGPQTQRFIERSTSHDSSGYYSIFKDPRRSATKWQNELTPSQIDEVLAVAKRFRVGNYYATCL